MDQYQPNHDSKESGHLHTRKEIIDKRKNLISGISSKDFFQRSREHIHSTFDYKNARTKEAKEKVLKEKGNVVGVIGQAGVGKSTLMKDLFYRNITSERLYKADFVFHLKLRDFFGKTEINLFQFLMGKAAYNSFEWIKDSVIRKEVLKLLSESESVCILLDGLDEADIDATHLDEESKIEFDINSENSPELFILGLLSGQIFPKAKKVITSRPSKMLDLPDIYKPKFLVKIFGIKQQHIKQICFDICSDEYASQVLFFIESQPDLLSYCLVPFNCVLIINCFNLFMEKKVQKFSPKTITDVFVLAFFFFSEIEHERKNCKKFDIKNFTDLEKISKLAWNGIKDQKLYFDEKDLIAANLNETNISSFTGAIRRSNEENRVTMLKNATKKCIYFSHLLLQEFFAATFCLFFMDFSVFSKTFFNCNQLSLYNNRFEMITKFMFGLFNPKTFEILKEIYPNISKPTKHMKQLTKFATTIASTITEKTSPDQYSNLDHVCLWAYETQDPEFCEKLAASLPETLTFKFDSKIRATDNLLLYCYVIKARKKITKLSIEPLQKNSYFATYVLLNRMREVIFNIEDYLLFCKEMESIITKSALIKVTISL